MSAEVTPEQLAEDAGWQAICKSALMAPTATIVGVLCNYAERRTNALLNEVERLTAERDWLREERFCPGCGRPQDWTGETSPGAPCMGCGRYPAARTNGAEAERDAALRDVAILRPAAAHAERAEAELRALRERMEVLADEFDAKGRRGSAHFGADVGDTIRLWIERDPRALLSDGPSA